MNVLLVGPDFEENLSIRYLISSLRAAGHEVTFAAFDGPKDVDQVLGAIAGADLVGLSMCFQVRAREFLGLARAVRAARPDLGIVAGGHYASCAARDLLQHHPEIDLVVLHEGERTLVEIADLGALSSERLASIQGIAYREGGEIRTTAPRHMVEDLDTLPLPDRSGRVRTQAGVPVAYLLGSRGCFGSCTYCCITTLHRMAPGKCFRRRSPERVADEMVALYRERGVRQFVFHDDNFLVPSPPQNHQRLDALARALESRGVRDIGLVIKCRPQDADESLLRRLRDMGLLRVFFGVETGTPAGLRCLNRQHTVAGSERTLDLCKSLGISAQFTIMVFHPDATMATVRDDIAFMRRHADQALSFCRAEIYAGTPLEQRMIAEGRARGDYLARVYSLGDPSVELLCNLWRRIFAARCTDSQGILNMSIGMDYRAAVIARFYDRPGAQALVGRIRAFCREVITDSLDRFEALAEACAGRADLSDPAAERTVRDIADGESDSRSVLEPEARAIIRAIDAFAAAARSPSRRSTSNAGTVARTLGFPAAAVLAAGLACSQTEMSEMAPPPVDARRGDTRLGDAGPDVAGEGVVRPDAGRDEPVMSEVDARPLDLRRDEPIMSEVDARPLDLRRDEPIMSEIDAKPLDLRRDEPIMSEIDAKPLDLRRDEPIMSEIDAKPLDLRKDGPAPSGIDAEPLDADKDSIQKG
jgi:anaerobic magnesium-protoporphyrin IX monomethyl ester cyclase